MPSPYRNDQEYRNLIAIWKERADILETDAIKYDFDGLDSTDLKLTAQVYREAATELELTLGGKT